MWQLGSHVEGVRCSVAVITAAQQFYCATTYVAVKSDHPNPLKRKTLMLNSVVEPEEKRRIIGDTFMMVRLLFYVVLI